MKYTFSLEPSAAPNNPAPKVVKAPPRKGQASSQESFLNRHKRWVVALLLLFLGGYVLYALWPNRPLNDALKLQAEVYQMENGGGSHEELREKQRELFQLRRALHSAELLKLREQMEHLETVKIKQFAAMTQEERIHYLDQQYEREEADRKAREARQAAAQAAWDAAQKKIAAKGNPGANVAGGVPGWAQGKGGPGGVPGGGGQVKGVPGAARVPGGGGGVPGVPVEPPPGRPKDQEQRDNRMREHLANTDPESRGLRYMMQVEDQRRRAELGLPPGRGSPWRGPPPVSVGGPPVGGGPPVAVGGGRGGPGGVPGQGGRRP